MAWVPPGVEVKNPEHWPLAKGDRQARRRSGRRGPRRGPLRRRRRRRGRRRRVRAAAGRHRSRGGARRAAPFVHEQLGTNKVHEWSLAGRRPRGRLRRGRRDRRAPGRQPPHRRRPDRAARRARRLPRRLADAVELDPGAALRAAVPRDPARDERGAGPRDRAGGRRRLRLQAAGLRRGDPRLLGLAQARAPGQVDRDAHREHGGRAPGARPDLARADGRQARRHDHRLPREDHRRLRRLQHAADAADPVARGVRDGRLLQDPGRPDRHRRRVHQQVPDRRDPRRRPARGDAHGRGDARPDGGASSGSTRSRSGARTSSPRRTSRRRSRPASSTTPATTRRRSTGCSSTSTSTAFRREQEELRGQGIYRGIGFSTYTEICGLAPSRITGPGGVGVQAGGWESAMVRVHNTGAVTAYTGSSRHGQGHETAFAQIVADRLGVDPADRGGDPRRHRHRAGGTQHLRLALAGGRRRGARAVRRQDRRQGQGDRRAQLEAAPEDIELRDGKFSVKGSPDKGDDARRGRRRGVPQHVPEGMEPGLEETTFYDPENFVFPFGAHACIVDVDAETGKAKVARYVAVDDCGKAINPLLIDGQVHGGIVHAIGQALYERVPYDEDGQLVTGTFVDYALPTAAELPSFELDRTETPSPVNSLGAKGVGEAGTIAASAAVTNAVIDALRPLGVELHQHAAHPDAGLGGDPEASRAEEVHGMIPAEFDYVAPDTLEDAIAALERRRRGRQAARRRPLADPADEAPAGHADAARGPAQGARAARRPARERQLADRGDDQAHRARAHPRTRASLSGAAGTIADPQVRNRGTIGGSLAHGDPASDLPAVLLIAEGDGHPYRDPAASGRSPPPICSATTSRPPSGRRGADRGSASSARRVGFRLPEVQPPQRGLGDGRGQRGRQEDRRRRRGCARRAD